MATYKVIQDIEAEDKLVGPLTLRQFIYGGIAALCAYLSYISLSKGFAPALIIFVPPMLFTAFFAFPWGRDQPTEVWALAKLRFYFKSRKRIWDQTGIKDLVTITAPKHESRNRTNGLSTSEVQSRLNALASTLDTRGWAVKNVATIPPLVGQSAPDRLIDISNLPKQVSPLDPTAAEDILDADNNVSAHRLQEMVSAAGTSHKQQLLDHMQHGTMPPPAITGQGQQDYWFTNNPISLPQPTGAATTTLVDDTVISEELHKRQNNSGDQHLKTIAPLPPVDTPTAAGPLAAPMTVPPDPATIHLSQRDDLTVSTIARIAKGEDNEVVISLH